MPNFIDRTGRVFGRLTVQGLDSEKSSARRKYWLCHCSCGTTNKSISADSLVAGTLSCGCLLGEIGRERGALKGKSRTPEALIWRQMIGRCNNPNNAAYSKYGAKGICVCDRWLDFEAFLEDMGPRPSAGHSIDRHPNQSGNYEPSNCRWATRLQQQNNMKRNHIVTYRGERMTVAEAARAAGQGVNSAVANARIRNGWEVARAVETPHLGTRVANELQAA